MQLTDTHCHIHEILGTDGLALKWHEAGKTDVNQVITDAKTADVTRLVCVGCTLADSTLAVDFVQNRQNVWASIGIHPHEAKDFLGMAGQEKFAALADKPKVVAIGECGLDYFYDHSPKDAQAEVLRFQLELAQKYDLPMIFHVREAFDDFWPIFDEYQGVRGVLHSFTDSQTNLERALQKGLYVGVNGIVTFTKDPTQVQMYKSIPLNHLLLETDAPFLTPAPYRGTICESKHVRVTAEFLATLRGETGEQLAAATSQNARHLFDLDR